MARITKAACIGGGVIGAGWAARLLMNGIDVALSDPAPGAVEFVNAALENARHAWGGLVDAPLPREGMLSVAASIGEAVTNAGLIVESVPERLDIKQAVYARIEATATASAIIASSTSGIMPSDLQAQMIHPGRLIVAHPFNPVYLLPLVEIVAGKATAQETVDTAMAFYATLGMKPLLVRKEIEAFIADRLLEAVWRESLWLVKDGIATTQDIDDAIRFGFGLRWAQMGLFETYRIAGGDGGMRHFLAQFGPCLQWPWTRLTDVPDLDDTLIETIAGQSDAQSGKLSIRDLMRLRDDNLVAILRALKDRNAAAGETVAGYERTLGDPPKA